MICNLLALTMRGAHEVHIWDTSAMQALDSNMAPFVIGIS